VKMIISKHRPPSHMRLPTAPFSAHIMTKTLEMPLHYYNFHCFPQH